MEKISVNFGPLKSLFDDRNVSEIMVNRYNLIFVEKDGRIQQSPQVFSSETQLLELIHQVAIATGRDMPVNRPFYDAVLPDGSRVNAVIPPMSPHGPTMTIRKFRKSPFTVEDYFKTGGLSHKAAYFLHACVTARLSTVVSGGTGTGKTTFLNLLSSFVPEHERLVSIEDVAELSFTHPNWVRLEPVYQQGFYSVTIRECLVNALRMRPDRIIVGECRKEETFEMLQAMNTGHEGSMTTIHANSTRDCLMRMESLVLTSKIDIPLAALRRQIASSINLIVQLKRTKNGQRIVTEISEVTGMEQNIITMQSIFHREKSKGGAAEPELLSSGMVPAFVERFSEAGIQLPAGFFDSKTKVTYRAE